MVVNGIYIFTDKPVAEMHIGIIKEETAYNEKTGKDQNEAVSDYGKDVSLWDQ